MANYQGSCHCGAVRFTVELDSILSGLRCNCSICSRKGALMSADVVPEPVLAIDADEDALALYQFGAKTAQHYFCRRCGIYTFHETARFPGHFRVNLGCLDGIDTLALPFEVFDGAHLL